MATVNYEILRPELPAAVGGSVMSGISSAQQVGAQQLQNQLGQLQLAQAGQEIAEQNKLRELMASGVDLDSPEVIKKMYQISPKQGMAFEKSRAELTKNRTEAQLKQFEANQQRYSNLSFNPSNENVVANLQDMVLERRISPEQAAQMQQKILTMPVEERSKFFLAMGADAKTRYTHGTVSAGTAASNAVTMRGQNMQDARARDKVEAEPATQALISKAILEGRLDPNRVNSRNIKMIGATLAMDPNANLRQMGEDAASSMASNRTIGTQQANVAMAATEARDMISIAKDLSNKVDRTRYPSINAIQNAIDKGTGDENLVAFNAAINAAVNTYARAINPKGVATVDSTRHARELINSKYSSGQFSAITDVMDKELKAAQQSGEKARGVLRGQPTNIPSGAITMLKSDPSLAAQFDLKYGAGASAKVLGK